MSQTVLAMFADAVLVLHALFVCFVVLSLPLILIGGCRAWAWVRNRWFRFTHMSAIGVVVAQSWFDQLCPLTHWENSLRLAAGESAYARGFIADWLHTLLFYQAPSWVFVLAYSLFGIAVMGAWWYVPPRSR